MREEESWCDKAKGFIEKQSHELERKIHALKTRRKAVKIAFVISITTSIICSTLCASLVGLDVPTILIFILSTTGALSTGLSTRFRLKRKQDELNRIIEKLERNKQKLDYVVSCNGNFSEQEFRKIIDELR